MLGVAREGQAGGGLLVVQAVVVLHDHVVARSFGFRCGQAGAVHVRDVLQVHVLLHNATARGRMVALLRHGLVDEGIAGSDEDVGLVAHRHGGDVVGVGRTGAAGLENDVVVHLGTRVGCRGGGIATDRHQGEQRDC